MTHIEISPIGFVRNEVKEWTRVTWEEIVSEVVLHDEWLEALRGLEEFSHIWIIAWLDRLPEEERGTRALVHPDGREDLPAVGLFSSRSPRRPNPIAVTAVPLLERAGTILRVRGLDLLDGTPVLDVKPYLARGDQILDVREPTWIRLLHHRIRA